MCPESAVGVMIVQRTCFSLNHLNITFFMPLHVFFLFYTYIYFCRDSSVCVTTRYGVDGPEIESLWGARFCPSVRTCPVFHPASYTMGTASFSAVKQPWSGLDQPPPSSAEFKDGVELYILSALWILAFSMVKFAFVYF